VKNPNIVGVRFIEPVKEVGFINETPTKDNSFTSSSGREKMIREALKMLVEKKDLSETQAGEVMLEIMEGKATSAQIAAFLTALRMKKETVEEIAGLAREMMNKVISFPWEGDVLVDTCGTGGDGKATFNISTTCAFVVAGAGVKVAKHGNRALSSQCGSADVLEEMGMKIDLPPHLVKKALEEVGIAFLFAPLFHQAMKYALSPRQEVGIRTVFNLLGPLTNPLGANIRLMGVYDPSLTHTLAQVMVHLGVKRAFVVWGEDGLDEVTIAGKTKVAELKNAEVESYWIAPEKLGVRRYPLREVQGGKREENARIIRDILSGRERGAKREIVLLNSALCLVGAGIALSLREGVKLAAESIDSGKALKKLKELIEFSNSFTLKS